MFSLSSCELIRNAFGGSSGMKPDVEAESLIEEGKGLLRAKRYIQALDAFQTAFDRDPHPQTSAALYYLGLSAYYSGDYDLGDQSLRQLLTTFRGSRYVPDAKYHLSLIDLTSRSFDKRKQAVKTLAQLSEGDLPNTLKADAQSQLQEALFTHFTIDELLQLKPHLTGNARTKLQETLLYQLIHNQQIDKAKIEYQAYQLNEGEISDYMVQLMGEEAELAEEESYLLFEPEIIRLALCLPLHIDYPVYGYNDKIPSKMTLGLEFYEGFSRGVNVFESQNDKQVYLQVFDTRRDTTTTASLLGQLDKFAPTLLVGAIYNAQSRILSDSAESLQVAQVIPISPTESLVEEKQYTFLGHPGSVTHGARMAEYAYDGLGLKEVYIFTDNTPGTADLTRGFIQEFMRLGGTVDTMEISRYYKTAIKEIPDLVKEIRDGEDTVGVYIPLLGNEESAGLIMNLLRQRGREVAIMGSPHFRARYSAIPREIKERYQVLFTTSHLVEEDKTYLAFYQEYLKDYGYPPSETVIQGYDLASYLLQRLDAFIPSLGYPVNTFLRAQESTPTLHINYWFKGAQSNQAVNIGQYQEGGVVRVNR